MPYAKEFAGKVTGKRIDRDGKYSEKKERTTRSIALYWKHFFMVSLVTSRLVFYG